MLILQHKAQQYRTPSTVQLTDLKHQHERQDLDPSALRLSGQTAIYSYRCRLETIVNVCS